jgi:peptidyl-prolyl cis-trans isomerase B (cyclophilin B)
MYFFFDIDGTLTTPLTSKVPDSTRKAIEMLRENGHFVAIATGRLQVDGWQVAQSLHISYAVTDGGNALTVNGKIAYDEGLPLQECIRTLTEIDYEKHPWAIVPENKMVRVALSPDYLNKVSDRYYQTVVDPYLDVKKTETIHKIFIACHREEADDIPLYGLPHVWFRPDTMLIEPVHKEKGIIAIQKRFHVRDEEIVVFGDGMNDQTMFRKEWMTIAMGNGKPALKKMAKYITARADDDGIYKACRHFGWI